MHDDAQERVEAGEKPRPTMAEVDHTPPVGDSVANVWHRGGETTIETPSDVAAD